MSNYFNSMSERTFRIVTLILFVVVFLVTMFMLAAGGASASTTSTDGPTVDRSTAVAPAWAWAKNWEACTNDEPQATRCVWHAPTMGNGTGHSYLQTKRGVIIYIKHNHARLLLLPTYAA